MRGRMAIQIGTIAVGVTLLIGTWACSSRQVTSGSEDQSMTTGKSGMENVSQDQVASVQPPSSGGSLQGQDTRPSLFTPSAPGSSTVPGTGSVPAGKGTTIPSDLTGLGDIFFDFDQYAVRKDAQAVLEGNARWLRKESGKTFLIEGHCDERGTLAYNLILGEKRAKAAKRYLEDLGIPASRLQTTTYGEVKPFCKDHNEGCWKQNRRAHFVVQ